MTCKNRYLLYLLAATLMLTACSGVEEGDALDNSQMAESQAVAFNAYVNRGITRGGTPGVVTTDALKTGTHASDGFGVMAYYTESRRYNQMALPNFMYNQQVTWDGTQGSWTYTPIKYWPNEAGNNGATTTDRLSFFAYAPYTDVDASTGRALLSPTTGIVGLSRSIDSGDPYVRYFATYVPKDATDLCWAFPTIDKTKPNVSEQVNFNFKHALSALNVQIDADVDDSSPNTVDTYTRIYVRSITFRGFAEKGQLNLNNSQDNPRWNNLDCDCDLSSDAITLYDGRRDGREGASASLNEQRTGLNPQIVQSGAYTVDTETIPHTFTSTTPGVTNTAVNLFDVSNWTYDEPANPTAAEIAAALAAPIYVLPTNEEMYVTIVYDVETYDPKLSSQYLSDGRTHGSTIENTISAYITDGSTPIVMEAGKQYTIKIHLGITSVKVDASVTKWPTDGTSANVQLPN